LAYKKMLGEKGRSKTTIGGRDDQSVGGPEKSNGKEGRNDKKGILAREIFYFIRREWEREKGGE